MDDRDLRRIEQAIANGFAAAGRPNVNRDPTTPRGLRDEDSKAVASSITAGLSKAFKITSDLLGRAVDQTLTVSDTADRVASVFQEFGAIGGVAGTVLTGLTDVVVGAVENWQYFSKFGLQFGGDAITLNTAIKKTGLSFNEYRDLLDTALPGLANFGEGLSRGAERFGDASEQLRASYGKQLSRLGMDFKDMNSVLALTVRGMSEIDKSSEGIDKLNLAAVRLAKEMDKTAQISGISRKAQEDNIRQTQDAARMQAMLARLMREDPEKYKDVNSAIEASSGLDPATRALFVELLTSGGVPTSADIADFSAATSAELGTRFQELMVGLNSDNKETREKTIEAFKQFPQDIALERGKSGSNSRLVEQGAINGKFVESMYGPGSPYNTILRNLLDAIKAAGGNEEVGRQNVLKNITNNQEGRLNRDVPGVGKEGEKNPLTATTEIVTNINTDIKSIGTSLNTLLGDINRSITTQRDKDNKLIIQEVVKATSSQTNTASGNRITDIQQRITGVIEELTNSSKKTGTVASFEDLVNVLKKEGIITDPKATPAAPTAPAAAPGPVSVAPASSSSISMPVSTVLASVNTRVSSETRANPSETDTARDIQIAGSSDIQDKLVEKLGEISIIMARVEQHTKNTALYSQDTSTSIKDIGPYA